MSYVVEASCERDQNIMWNPPFNVHNMVACCCLVFGHSSRTLKGGSHIMIAVVAIRHKLFSRQRVKSSKLYKTKHLTFWKKTIQNNITIHFLWGLQCNGRVRVGRTHLVAGGEKHTFKLPAATYLGIKGAACYHSVLRSICVCDLWAQRYGARHLLPLLFTSIS